MMTGDVMRRAMLVPLLALLLALGLGLLLAVGLLGAPGRDIADLLSYLLASGLISLVLAGGGAAWLSRGRGRLWFQLTLAYTLGVAIALFNVSLTAGLMFISLHDQLLLMLLLAVAAVVSLGMSITLAHALASRVDKLRRGAHQLGEGDLAARVAVRGDDELADLAREFNRMAGLLAETAADRDRADAARREMVAAVSHDLRTPLASLRVMIEALEDGVVDDPETTARYLAGMRAQLGRLNTLIDDLFELAQIDAGALRLDIQPTVPGDLVSDLIEGLLPQAEVRNVSLAGRVAPNLPATPLAADKIERALANLVTNAIRHTPAGGAVTISAAAGDNGALLFAVEDTGEGIAAADLPHIFERFYRGEKSRSRATGGAGLGLAITRGIVAAHGGQIWAESEPGRGARVTFTIPGR
jgi:signal transduction histidine kinase